MCMYLNIMIVGQVLSLVICLIFINCLCEIINILILSEVVPQV